MSVVNKENHTNNEKKVKDKKDLNSYKKDLNNEKSNMNSDCKNLNNEKNNKKDSKLIEKDFKELKDKLDLEKNKSEEYLELLKRTKADFENYKKRIKKEISESVFFAKKEVILNFIVFKDTLLRAYKHEKDPKSKEDIKQLIINFDNILKRLNIQEINCLNKEFDYLNSDCILKKKVDNKKDHNKVIEVIEKGYLLNNKLIKPAKVIVGVKEE
jgi:molecular chaperone GrpE